MNTFLLISFFCLSLLSNSAYAVDEKVTESITSTLQQFMPNLKINSIEETPLEGIYEVGSGNEYIYMSGDGRYYIYGDLIDTEQKWNVTEESRSIWRKKLFNDINLDSVISFAATNEKHNLYVFTDIDCGYCRKLHDEIEKLNNAGITVNYLAYPRTGEFSPAWNEMAKVWCSNDRQTAITDAKADRRDKLAEGRSVEDVVACGEIIKQHFEQGELLSIKGTPAIYLDTGDTIKGYMPADKLITKIESIKNSYNTNQSASR